MVFKANIHARIKRHSRILKTSLSSGVKDKNYYSYGYNFVIFAVILLLPNYPVLASFVHDNTLVDFYRGDIDETSILESYIGDDQNGVVVESRDSFLSINTALNGQRDLSGINEIISYEVKEGDSLSTIATRHGVSTNSIVWANNLSKNPVLKPGQVLKIPPVSGVVHEVRSGETLSTIAAKYDIDEETIRAQNNLGTKGIVVKGTALVIPGATKRAEVEQVTTKKAVATTTKKTTTKTTTKKTASSGGYTFAGYAESEDVDDSGTYQLVKRKPQHTFYWGNCTWFVAQYKNVNWGGNAKDWLKNAANAGHPTGSKATLGSIIVFFGKGYNPKYGHVGIVTEVQDDHIIVKDMNYRKLNEVTVRKVPKSDKSIRGYIYVD